MQDALRCPRAVPSLCDRRTGPRHDAVAGRPSRGGCARLRRHRSQFHDLWPNLYRRRQRPGRARAGAARCPPSPDGKMTRRVDSRLTRYGGAVSIRGRVTRTPVPSDAVVTLVEPSGLRATDSAARVRRDGRFRIRLRPGRSRTVRPILVEASGNPRLCGESIHVKVRAGVAFAAAPKRLRNSEVINLRGRLRGLPLPRTGKTITIEARARGSSRWTTVTALRTGSSGRFAYRYRFRRTFQRTTYEFRAVSPSQRGYPFARGWSSVSRAVVRP
jgi:hypothetical protein